MFEAEMAKPRPKPRDLNHVLAALPAGDYRRIASKIEQFSFRRGQPLYEPDRPISHVYFPRTGVASIVTRLAEGGTIEIATVGNEGMVGLPAYLGNGNSPMEVMVQISGDAARMSSRTFRQEIRAVASLRHVIQRYTLARMTQVGQSAACNRVHAIVQRCARWLLTSHDRVPGDRFHLTQEFLAEMLGVRRATVTQAAGALKRRGLVDYRRGVVRILDRKGLEKTACECYGLIRSEHQRLVG